MEVAVVEGLVCDGSDGEAVAAAIMGAEGGQDAGVGAEAELLRIRVRPKAKTQTHPKRNWLLMVFLSRIRSARTGPRPTVPDRGRKREEFCFLPLVIPNRYYIAFSTAAFRPAMSPWTMHRARPCWLKPPADSPPQ